jgi:hypothetical protein
MNTFKNISSLLIPFSKGFKRNKYLSDDDLPYHRFSLADYERLLNPFSSDTDLIFKNLDNEEIKFQLVKSTLGKKVFKKLISGFGFKKYFFYDEQEIQFKVSKNENSKLTFNLKKFPDLNSNHNGKLVFFEYSKLIATIDFPFLNGKNTFVIDYQKPISTMILNEKTYNNVLIFESGNTETIETKTINRIYFDVKKGIIGFDDLNERKWRLSN